jgi:hypothetical protein
MQYRNIMVVSTHPSACCTSVAAAVSFAAICFPDIQCYNKDATGMNVPDFAWK